MPNLGTRPVSRTLNAAPIDRAAFKTFVAEEVEKFTTIVSEAGITID